MAAKQALVKHGGKRANAGTPVQLEAQLTKSKELAKQVQVLNKSGLLKLAKWFDEKAVDYAIDVATGKTAWWGSNGPVEGYPNIPILKALLEMVPRFAGLPSDEGDQTLNKLMGNIRAKIANIQINVASDSGERDGQSEGYRWSPDPPGT